MPSLRVLFTSDCDEAAKKFWCANLDQYFEEIIDIRRQLYNGKPRYEVVNAMKDLGVTIGEDLEQNMKISFLYEQLSKAEVRLTQVKKYIAKKKEYKKREQQARENGNKLVNLKAPAWEI